MLVHRPRATRRNRTRRASAPTRRRFLEIADAPRARLRRRPPGARPRGARRSSTRAKSARPRSPGSPSRKAWRNAPRPVAGRRPAARARARRRPARPRDADQPHLPPAAGALAPSCSTTLWCYLDNGRSLEATARELFVHPNTVRYRLKRVSEVIGWDATGPREALILQTALILGSIGDRMRPQADGIGTQTSSLDCAARTKRFREFFVTRSPQPLAASLADWNGDRRRLPRTGLPDPRIPRPLARRLHRSATSSPASRTRPASTSSPTARVATPTPSATPRSPSRSSSPPACSRCRRCSPTAGASRVGGIAGHSVGELDRRGRRRHPERDGCPASRARARRRDGRAAAADADRHERRDRRRRGRAARPARRARPRTRRTTTAAARSSSPARSTPSPRSPTSPPAGARVIPLQVAGAFHTRYMAARRRARCATSRRPRRGIRPDAADLDQPRRLAASTSGAGVRRPARRPGRLARALGPLHGVVRRRRRHRASSSSRRPAPSSGSPSAASRAFPPSRSRRRTTSPPPSTSSTSA